MSRFTTRDPEMQRFAESTANGVKIEPGVRFWSNDLKAGVVLEGDPEVEIDGMPWWPVQMDGETRGTTLDGWRMTTVHPFNGKKA